MRRNFVLPRLVALVLGLAFIFTCGCTRIVYNRALEVSLTSLNTTRDGLVAWSEVEQKQIVEQAKSFEEGKAALEQHRQKRDKVVKGLIIAYGALAVASLEPKPENLAIAAGKAAEVYRLVKELMGGAP